MKIVETLTCKTSTLEVKSSDAITNDKVEIQEKEGTPPDHQRLIVPEGSHTLADCNFRKEPTLHLTPPIKDGGMQIFIKSNLIRRTLTLDVESSDTIDHVKKMIQHQIGMLPVEQRLIFGKEQLKGGHTLADYNIKKDSVVVLVFKLRGGGVKISYKAQMDKTFTIEFKSSDTPPTDTQDLERADTTLSQPSSWLQRLSIVISIKKWGYRFFGAWK